MGCKALELAAQGSSGVIIPAIVKNAWMWHLRTWFNGKCGGRLMVGRDDHRDLFQL